MKDEPLAPTMIAAWAFQALFVAALVWGFASEPLYFRSPGPRRCSSCSSW